MARVLTDNKYYGQIADVIREQNGTSNTYTPPQMVRALKDLFYEEVEGVPPITFQGIGENLLDYRIDGASGGVGDRTGNLFDGECFNNSLDWNTGDIIDSENQYRITTSPIFLSPGNYTIKSYSTDKVGCATYNSNMDFIGILPYVTVLNLTIDQTRYIRILCKNDSVINPILPDKMQIMLNSGSTALPYEPYGYKVPVVVNGKNLLDFENPSIKTFNLEKISNGIYQANTNKAFLANRWALDTEAGVQYRILGTTNNSEITIQLSDFIDGTSSPQGGQIRANESINLTFTATGKTTLSIFSRLANQSFTATNFQIYKSSIADTSYEPYHEPTTTNIYLDEPISEGESISLSDTEIDIPTIRGTNVLSVDTTVQPSNVYVKSRKESSYEAAMRERYEEAQAQLDALESE